MFTATATNPVQQLLYRSGKTDKTRGEHITYVEQRTGHIKQWTTSTNPAHWKQTSNKEQKEHFENTDKKRKEKDKEREQGVKSIMD